MHASSRRRFYTYVHLRVSMFTSRDTGGDRPTNKLSTEYKEQQYKKMMGFQSCDEGHFSSKATGNARKMSLIATVGPHHFFKIPKSKFGF